MSEEEERFDMTTLKDAHAQHTSKNNFTIQQFVYKMTKAQEWNLLEKDF